MKKKYIFMSIIEGNSMTDARASYPPSKKEDSISNYKKEYAKNISISPTISPNYMSPSTYHPKNPREDSSKN